ncbi:MAG: SGNH/GDSL hydrolase family protein [Planctomycetota bacterium]|nr:SGNH/GDSL hydrolase family protein [Planctomycetota bacterium]
MAVFLISGIGVVAEIALRVQDTDWMLRSQTVYRHIRLVEHPPRVDAWLIAPKEYERNFDKFQRARVRFRTDENGYILGPEGVIANPDITMAFHGGSTTECLYVNEELRFPSLVARLLMDRTGLKIRALNGGRSRACTLDSLNAILNKTLAFKPDIIVMMHNINDLSLLMYCGSYYNDNATRSTVVSNSRGTLETLQAGIVRLARSLSPAIAARIEKIFFRPDERDEWAKERQRRGEAMPAEMLCKNFRANLEIFIAICRAHGVVPVLMTMANRFAAEPDKFVQAKYAAPEGGGKPFGGLPYEEFRQRFLAMNETIRQTAKDNGVLLIDLAAVIPPDGEHMYSIVHFTDRGSEMAAKAIAQSLEPLLRDLVARKKGGSSLPAPWE